MTTILALDYKVSVVRVASLINEGLKAWRDAGELLVAVYDEDPANRGRVKVDLANIPQPILTTLERIGRRQLVPQVYSSNGPGYRKLAKMSYDVQEFYLVNPVELVVETSRGVDVLKVSVDALSVAQVKQVFGDTAPRDPAAQRAYLADCKRRAAPVRCEDAYELRKDSLIVTRPCELTRQQLTSLLAQMR